MQATFENITQKQAQRHIFAHMQAQCLSLTLLPKNGTSCSFPRRSLALHQDISILNIAPV